MPICRSMLVLALAMGLPALAADTYKIDAGHSEIGFKVRHFVSKTPGRFTKFEGVIQVETSDISKSSVELTIQADSISTDNANRDGHLKSPDFLDVAKFPVITFKSTSVKEVAKGQLEITGDFTMHGVTKRITFPITNLGTVKSPFGDTRGGFVDGMLKLNRKDFGIVWNKALDNGGVMLGDEVEVSLNVEAVKK